MADGDALLLSLFASALSHRRFGDQELRLLDAALSAGADVPALLHTRSSARQLLRESAAQAFSVPDLGTTTRLSIAGFFARAFALAGDVESCLAMTYEALLLREAKYSDDLHLQVSNEEWLAFAKDSFDNGFYTIASKAFANALVHICPSRPVYLDSTNSILKKDKISDISGLQNLAKSLSALRSVHRQSAEYMKRKASGAKEKCNLHLGKAKLPESLMFRPGIKTRRIQKLHHSQERNSDEA
ncbi:hypothetical protein E2562_030118 [Oryza meyeriana var. granulata]|uniref:Uncharacterized protein n=1 Tax=Oryza meyeriana var. granulata TaxID=110450 RepID=A0A6G1BP32_9ORYZ|nr:hypothetical protein E2562_030118 [Oryza meyeriana var. granulata]